VSATTADLRPELTDALNGKQLSVRRVRLGA
jgi:hypothetical protein